MNTRGTYVEAARRQGASVVAAEALAVGDEAVVGFDAEALALEEDAARVRVLAQLGVDLACGGGGGGGCAGVAVSGRSRSTRTRERATCGVGEAAPRARPAGEVW